MSGTISRRQALGLLAASVATVIVSSSDTLGAPRAGRLALNAELDAWINERIGQSDLKGIATAWRSAHSDESSEERLTRLIIASRKPRESLDGYLARIVADEHKAGRAELVDGWFLAPTEARIATLVDIARR